MTETEILKATECCKNKDCVACPLSGNRYESKCKGILFEAVIDLINRKNAENENYSHNIKTMTDSIYEMQKRIDLLNYENLQMVASIKGLEEKAIKEVFAKVDETLKRYSHVHKHAEKARHSTEEYADGTPMEMVSVWEVLSLKKWEMADYENMIQLQENIETISKARLLEEIEKDFRLLAKEMGCGE